MTSVFKAMALTAAQNISKGLFLQCNQQLLSTATVRGRLNSAEQRPLAAQNTAAL